MRIIGAEMTSLDPDGQMAAKQGHDLVDLTYRSFDSLGDRRASSLGLRTSPAIPAPESYGCGDLIGNEVHLFLRLAGLLRIVQLLGRGQIASKFFQSPDIFGLGLRIEDRIGISGPADPRDCLSSRSRFRHVGHTNKQIADMKFPSRMAQEASQAIETARRF